MNQLHHTKRVLLKQLLIRGASNRQIQSTLGISHATITRYKALWEVSAICGCGKPSGHQGWCWYRLQFSPNREGFLVKRWRKRSTSELTQRIQQAANAAKAMGHTLGPFVWGSPQAVCLTFATCRICGKSVRVFDSDSQWARFKDWPCFAGGAVEARCKTVHQRAVEKAAKEERKSWRNVKQQLQQVRSLLRQPNSQTTASRPAPTSRG